jgi:serine/threonine-protein kinase RsbW
MPPEKNLELHIPSVLGFERVAMEFAAAVAKMRQLPEDRIEDLKTAVAEACLNAIEHGHKLNAAMKVAVSLTIDDSTLQVSVRDEGPAIGEIKTPSIDSKIEGEIPPRGWGIFLIKNLVDEVQFEAAPEGGNVVRMIIHLDHPS